MSLSPWRKLLRSAFPARDRLRTTFRPRLEALEDRTVPTTNTYTVDPGASLSSTNFHTIQDAINQAETDSGADDLISVVPGTFAELLTVHSTATFNSLEIEGAKAETDADTRFANFTNGANGPKADPTVETVLTTPTKDYLANNLLTVQHDNVEIDGLVIDGNNTAATGSTSITSAGVEIDVNDGIRNGGTPVFGLDVEYSIIQNVAETGVHLVNSFTSSGLNSIHNNVIRNFGINVGDGVGVFENAFADVTENTIVDLNGSIGLDAQRFTTSHSMTFGGNTLTVAQDGFGIHLNNFFGSGGDVLLAANTVNAAPGVTGTSGITRGINVWSIQTDWGVDINGNTVGSSGGQFARGIDLWNLPTSIDVLVHGGSVGNSAVGIDLDNINPFGNETGFDGRGAATTVDIKNITLSGDTTGVRVATVPVTEFGDSSATNPTNDVTANLTNVIVSGATTGLFVAGDAAVPTTATATVLTSTFKNGTTGIDVEANGTLGAGSKFNQIFGNTTAGLVYNGSGFLSSPRDWWGAATGPTNANDPAGSGDKVIGNVNFWPFATSTAFNNFVNITNILPTDPGFETPSQGTGSGAFHYNPAGSAWTFSGTAGLAGNGSAFTSGNPAAPQGTQVAFVQRSGSVSQAVSFETPGTYVIGFSAAQRGNFNATTQSIQVQVDGSSVGTFTPVGTSYGTYTTATFTVPEGTHTVKFVGLNPNGGDNTALLDQVAISAAALPQFADLGFETPGVGSGGGAFKYGPAGSSWTFFGTAGLTGNNSIFTNGNGFAPQGAQVAFVQQLGSITQVTTFPAGTYVINFLDAQRAFGNASGSGETFNVLVDGVSKGTFDPSGPSYALDTTSPFTVTAGPHTIVFQGTDTNGGGDNTALLDQVTITAAAPPSLANAGFELPAVGTGGSAFQYDPVGASWTYAGTAGVAGNGSVFTFANAAAPQGVQVGFLQGTGSFSQAINFGSAGSYTIGFSAAQRGTNNATYQTFQVQVDGTVISTFAPPGSAYTAFTTASFNVASSGTHTIAFVGVNPNGGDNTALLDQVSISPAPLPQLADPNFAGPGVGTGGSAFKYDPAGPSWTFTGTAGLAGNGSVFTFANPAAPAGTQVAFVQQTGSVSQAAYFAAGTYTVSFSAAQRGTSNTNSQSLQVLVDGVLVSTVTPANTSYLTYTTDFFTVGAGTHTVQFLGTNGGGGDNTALLDQVAINAAS